MAFLTAPTVLTWIDDSIDVSVFYTSAEEEEKGNEKNKDMEKVFCEGPHPDPVFSRFNPENELEYFFKAYPKPHLNIISPPPEMNIL